MPSSESHALSEARRSAAADLEMHPDTLALAWDPLGRALEALELDLDLRPGDVAMAWEAIARAWRDVAADLELTPEQIGLAWESVSEDLQRVGPEAITLVSSLNAEPLILQALRRLDQPR